MAILRRSRAGSPRGASYSNQPRCVFPTAASARYPSRRRSRVHIAQASLSQRDPTIQFRARNARAELLLALGRSRVACDVLADLWKHDADTELGAEAGLRAADIAEQNLKDRERALALYRDVMARAVAPAAQVRGRAAIERLTKAPT